VTGEKREMVTVSGLNAYLSRRAEGATGGMLLLPMISGISARVREYATGWPPWV
jgi:carboxymethylenebutenolidase